jgi:hypothetical protein
MEFWFTLTLTDVFLFNCSGFDLSIAVGDFFIHRDRRGGEGV